MAPGHLYAGNRVRTAGPIKLRSDMAWAEKLTPAQKRLTWLLAGHKLRHYGYELKPEHPLPECSQSETKSKRTVA
mgnify:CR=1 FL=1